MVQDDSQFSLLDAPQGVVSVRRLGDGEERLYKTVGMALEHMRKELGWKPNDVAEKLNIKLEYVCALEKDDYSAMPNMAYVIGFVRSYARLVGLDADPFVEALKDVKAGDEKKRALPEPIENRIVPSRQLVVGSLLLFFLICVVWALYIAGERIEAGAIEKMLGVEDVAGEGKVEMPMIEEHLIILDEPKV